MTFFSSGVASREGRSPLEVGVVVWLISESAAAWMRAVSEGIPDDILNLCNM